MTKATRICLDWFILMSLILWAGLASAATLNDDYHAIQFRDDQVSTGGYSLTNRMDLSFDGTNTGYYTHTASSNPPVDPPGSFPYTLDEENVIIVGAGDDSDFGSVDFSQNVFALGNTYIDELDNSLMLMLGARKSTGMGVGSISGDYLVGQYISDSISPANINTARYLINFDAAGNLSYSTLASSDGGGGSGNDTYSVTDNGFMSMAGGDGFLADNSEFFAVVDTDATDSSVHIMAGVKSGSGMVNGDLIGNFSLSTISFDYGKTWSERSLLSFDGTGNGFFVSLDTTSGPDGSGGFTYSVATDGTVTVDGSVLGAISSNGEYLLITDTDTVSGVLEFGVGIKRPVWQVYSWDTDGYIDWQDYVHSPVPTNGYLVIGGSFYYISESYTGSWNNPGYPVVRLETCDQFDGTPSGVFADTTGMTGMEIAYLANFPVSTADTSLGNAEILSATGSNVEWSTTQYDAIPSIGDYVEIDCVFYLIDDAGSAGPGNNYVSLIDVDQDTGNIIEVIDGCGVGCNSPQFANIPADKADPPASYIYFYDSSWPIFGQCANNCPADGIGTVTYSTQGAPNFNWGYDEYVASMGDYVLLDGTVYSLLNVSEYQDPDPQYSYRSAILQQVDQETGVLLEDPQSPGNPLMAQLTGNETDMTARFFTSFPYCISDCPADGIGIVTYSTQGAPNFNWGYDEYVASMGDYVLLDGTVYSLLNVSEYQDPDPQYSYRSAILQQVDQETGVLLEDPQSPGNPLMAQLTGNETDMTARFFTSFPSCISLTANPNDPIDTDGDGMSDAYEDANGLDKNSSNDKDGNLDGDGASNYEEFLAGTDPDNDADYPQPIPVSIDVLNASTSTPLAADSGPVQFRIYTAPGSSVFVSLYLDEDFSESVNGKEWPLTKELVTDDSTEPSGDFSADSNTVDSGQIEITFGAGFGMLGVGNYVALVENPDGSMYSETAFAISPGTPANFITGQVVEQDNPSTGVENALVWFVSPIPGEDDEEVITFGFTSSSGYFNLGVNSPLPLNGFIGADKNDGKAFSTDMPTVQVNMTDNVNLIDPVELVVVNDGSQVTGQLLDYFSLRPLPNVEVNIGYDRFYAFDYTTSMPFDTTVGEYALPLVTGPGEQSWVEVEQLPPGYFAALEADSGGFNDGYFIDSPAPVPPMTADFWAFPETAWFDFEVRDEYYAPEVDIVGAQVYAKRDKNAGLPWSNLSNNGITGENSKAIVGVNEGEWEIGLSFNDGIPLVDGIPREMVPMSPPPALFQTTEGNTIPVYPNAYYAEGAIEGYVFWNNGNPADDVDVIAWNDNAENNPGNNVGTVTSSARTDMNGFYRVPVLGGSNWHIKAESGSMISNLYGDDNIPQYFSSGDDVVDPIDVFFYNNPLILIGDHCNNGQQDGDETGQDSGGSCDMQPPIMTLSVAKDGDGDGLIRTVYYDGQGYTPDGNIDTTTGSYNYDYTYNQMVDLQAFADPFSKIISWSEPACGTDTECSVTMDIAKTVTVTFENAMKTLTVDKGGTGDGLIRTVYYDGQGYTPDGDIDTEAASFSHDYYENSMVDLQAFADPFSKIIGWSEPACGTDTECSVTMDIAKTVTVTFENAMKTLTVAKGGTGDGLIRTVYYDGQGYTPDGDINTEAASFSHDYYENSLVDLQAFADPFSKIISWSEPACGTDTECSVTMDIAKTVTVTFENAMKTLTVDKGGTGDGLIRTVYYDGQGYTPDGDINTEAASFSHDYYENSMVDLQAFADPFSKITGWSEPACGTDTECSVTMDIAKTVTVTFENAMKTLTVDKGGTGDGLIRTVYYDGQGYTPDGDIDTEAASFSHDYYENNVVDLEAFADPFSKIISWSEPICGANTSCTVSMDVAKTVTVTFELDTDQDGIIDSSDTCPLDPDNDIDGDGVCGDVDNCPSVANGGQEDGNFDGVGDACTSVAPFWIWAPDTNSNGTITVDWGDSATPGAIYQLHQANNPAFTGATVAYQGSASITTLYNRTDGTYYFRVKTKATGYLDSTYAVWSSGTVVTKAATTPTWIFVPSNNTTGSYTVDWGEAPAGATEYVLERATLSNFSDATEIYRGGASIYTLNNQNDGAYYYRVKTVVTGSADSPYLDAGNPCNVALTVAAPYWIWYPNNRSKDTVTIDWATSTTPGAGYVLEIASQSNFSDASPIYTGPDSIATVPVTNGVWYFRVKGTKGGFADSSYVSSGTAMNVTLTVEVPYWIAVPNNSTGSHSIQWGNSATSGVEYTLEEATQSNFSDASVVYTGTGQSILLSGRAPGTYYYRVKATRGGYVESGYKTGTNSTLTQ